MPYNISATFSLLIYLLKNRVDIVQTSLFNANFHGRIAAFFARIPVVISEEHSEHYLYNSIKFLPYIYADRILSIFTDSIICCSRNLMASISKLERIPLNKFFPLVNTFNEDKLKVSIDSVDIKKELGLSENDFIVGNIASLCKRKGQSNLIKAFHLIIDKIPYAKLIFVGGDDPAYKKELLSLVCSLGLSDKVLFLGKRENIVDYFNIIDIFVLSSLSEGIPLVMLEAMFMQIPVIATEVGGVSEVIANNENGILLKSNDVEGLANAILELFNNRQEQKRLACEGKRTVLEKFSAQRYVKQLEGLYIQLCKNKIRKFVNLETAVDYA